MGSRVLVRWLVAICLLAIPAAAQDSAVALDLVAEARASIDKGNMTAAEQLVEGYRQAQGVTPEYLEALSWLGRGALGYNDFDEADRFAQATYRQVLPLLEARDLDAGPRLPTALGAAIETEALVMDRRHATADAVSYLESEIERWRGTSIVTRLYKNLHLLSLEGKPAPPLVLDGPHLGPEPEPLSTLTGEPYLLYFWAHWCSDCALEAPILARLHQEHPDLKIIGPTQLYGYAQAGEDATPAEELAWIQQVRDERYATLTDMPSPINAVNFIDYGCSSTPTLVLVNRDGIVALYHPGWMTYEELKPKIVALLR